jgi:hypothetical protein
MAPLDVGHPHPPEGREESILRLINLLACVSGVSAVLLVSPAIEVAAYRALRAGIERSFGAAAKVFL